MPNIIYDTHLYNKPPYCKINVSWLETFVELGLRIIVWILCFLNHLKCQASSVLVKSHKELDEQAEDSEDEEDEDAS